MIDPMRGVVEWIKQDWHGNPWRFCIEALCWTDSLVCAIILNTTVPDLPWMWLYPLWITGNVAYAWCAWSRGSVGMLATFIMLIGIDTMGLLRLLLR